MTIPNKLFPGYVIQYHTLRVHIPYTKAFHDMFSQICIYLEKSETFKRKKKRLFKITICSLKLNVIPEYFRKLQLGKKYFKNTLLSSKFVVFLRDLCTAYC
jgi:hypothetical protein